VPFWRPRGCVLWFDFLEPKGDTAYDKSGYDNHGTIYGATRVRALGRYGISFDGVDDYVGVPFWGQMELPITLCALVYPKYPAPNPPHQIFSNACGRSIFTHILHDGKVGITLLIDTEWQARVFPYYAKWNKWNHLVFVLRGVEPEIYCDLYADGKYIETVEWTGYLSRHTAATRIAHHTTGVRMFYGFITHVRIYDRVLPEREIRANHAYFFSRIKRAV